MGTMNSKAFCILLVILLSGVFAGGCIDELIAVQEKESLNLSSYEIAYYEEGNVTTFNETTFYLTNEGFATALYALDNASSIEIVPMEDLTNPTKEPLSDIVIIAGDSGNVTDVRETLRHLSSRSEATDLNFTIEEKVKGGQKSQVIGFNRSVTGFVAFKLAVPLGQDFIYMPTHHSVLRIVLPEGYTTGNRFIGKVQPEANYTYYDERGRQVLVWLDLRDNSVSLLSTGLFNIEEENQQPVRYRPVILKFYSDSATRGLLIGTTILGLAALIVAGNYMLSRRRLEEQCRDIEQKGIKK
jgi:hypothetical protein